MWKFTALCIFNIGIGAVIVHVLGPIQTGGDLGLMFLIVAVVGLVIAQVSMVVTRDQPPRNESED